MATERLSVTETRPACILVVDDEPLVAAIIADTLGLEGYEVDTAKNGREALEKIAARSYDAILSDLRMPELDGIGATQHLPRPGLPNCRRLYQCVRPERKILAVAARRTGCSGPRGRTLRHQRAQNRASRGTGRDLDRDFSAARLHRMDRAAA